MTDFDQLKRIIINNKKTKTDQYFQARALQQGDLVGDGEVLKAGNSLCKLHDFHDGLGAEVGELLPQLQLGFAGNFALLLAVLGRGLLGNRGLLLGLERFL